MKIKVTDGKRESLFKCSEDTTIRGMVEMIAEGLYQIDKMGARLPFEITITRDDNINNK